MRMKDTDRDGNRQADGQPDRQKNSVCEREIMGERRREREREREDENILLCAFYFEECLIKTNIYKK